MFTPCLLLLPCKPTFREYSNTGLGLLHLIVCWVIYSESGILPDVHLIHCIAPSSWVSHVWLLLILVSTHVLQRAAATKHLPRMTWRGGSIVQAQGMVTSGGSQRGQQPGPTSELLVYSTVISVRASLCLCSSFFKRFNTERITVRE